LAIFFGFSDVVASSVESTMCKELTVNHLEILKSVPVTQVRTRRDNLLVKTTGKFYTPKFIGERLGVI
jgi:hypothetical protein